MKGGIGANVLLLLLALNVCLSSKELRVQVIKSLLFSLGSECLNKRIEIEVEAGEDIIDHILIFQYPFIWA
jgi:hypothetical protein